MTGIRSSTRRAAAAAAARGLATLRWLDYSNAAKRHAVRFTPIFAALVTITSICWQLDGWPHHAVAWFAEYRPEQLSRWTGLRVAGGALLIPNSDFFFGLPGLLAATWAVERRVGTWILAFVAGAAHVTASLLAGVIAHLTQNMSMLSDLDVGTSVVMVSSAALLGTLSRSGWVWALTATALAIDGATVHDLATAEHLFATAIGTIAGLSIDRLQRHRDRLGAA